MMLQITSATNFSMKLAILSCVFLSACDAALEGQPKKSFNSDRKNLTDIVLDNRLSQKSIIDALNNPSDVNRNRIVLARIAEIDLLYSEFETKLLAESRKSGFALSFAGLAAGILGGNAIGVASQNLSLLSGGISALQTSYEKEVLAERTINAFIAQMRAGRSNVLARIYGKLSVSVSRYSIEASLSDLERYRQAGTLATAIVGLTEQAVEIQKTSEVKARASEQKFLITGTKRITGTAIINVKPSTQRELKRLGGNIASGATPEPNVVLLLNQSETIPDETMRGTIANLKAALFGSSSTTVTIATLNEGLGEGSTQTKGDFVRGRLNGIIQNSDSKATMEKIRSILE